MRDASDMMEDALSENTMMDCDRDDGSLEDFVDSASDISDDSPTIRDAFMRLVTLLRMDKDDDEDLLSDEGVEADIFDELDNEKTMGTAELFYHFTTSVFDGLKDTHGQSSSSSSRATRQDDNSMRSVEMLQDTHCLGRGCLQDQTSVQRNGFDQSDVYDNLDEQEANFVKFTNFASLRQEHRQEQRVRSRDPSWLDRRLWTDDPGATEAGRSFDNQGQDPDSWAAGWDACATEALRYLVEDEGLPLHHPTVIAMKDHLDLQREKAFTQYTGCTEPELQPMSLVLD